MQLYGVRIFVDDLTVARAFYEGTLGLTVAWDMGGQAFGVEVGRAELIIEQEAPGDRHADLVGRFVGVSLSVPQIETAFRDLSARGVPFQGPPVLQPWGGKLAHFSDPAGNVLTLLG